MPSSSTLNHQSSGMYKRKGSKWSMQEFGDMVGMGGCANSLSSAYRPNSPPSYVCESTLSPSNDGALDEFSNRMRDDDDYDYDNDDDSGIIDTGGAGERLRKLREEKEAALRYAEERKRARLARKGRRKNGGGGGRSSRPTNRQPEGEPHIRGSASREPNQRGRGEQYIAPPPHGRIGVDPIRVERSKSREPKQRRAATDGSRRRPERYVNKVVVVEEEESWRQMQRQLKRQPVSSSTSRGVLLQRDEETDDSINGGAFTPDEGSSLPSVKVTRECPSKRGGAREKSFPSYSSSPASPSRSSPASRSPSSPSKSSSPPASSPASSSFSVSLLPHVAEHLSSFASDDNLVRVILVSSSFGDEDEDDGDEFSVPASLVVKRELEMRRQAEQFGIGPDRWNGSLLARKLQEVALEREMAELEKKMAGLGLPGRGAGGAGAGGGKGGGGGNGCGGAPFGGGCRGALHAVTQCGALSGGKGRAAAISDLREANLLSFDEAGVGSGKPYTFVLDPESECATPSVSECSSFGGGGGGGEGVATNDFEWNPALTSCIRSFYNTGTVRVPDSCRGNDVLLALEYFGIVYAPDQLAFDSFGCYLRVKLWSDYYTHRASMAEWVANRLMEGRSRHSHSFVTSPEPDDVVYVGSKRCDIMDGGLILQAGENGRSPKSCSVVHEFFNDDDDDRTPLSVISGETDETRPIDSLLRDDFCAFVQSSLPGTIVTFAPREVTLSRGLTVTRAVLRIDFVSRKKKTRKSSRPAATAAARGKTEDVTTAVIRKDDEDGGTVISALDDEVEVRSYGGGSGGSENGKSASSLAKSAAAQGAVLSTLEEDEEADAENGTVLPLKHIKGGHEGTGVFDGKSVVSALSSPFKEVDESEEVVGSDRMVKSDAPATPERGSAKNRSNSSSPKERAVSQCDVAPVGRGQASKGGVEKSVPLRATEPAQRYLNNWVVEEEDQPFSGAMGITSAFDLDINTLVRNPKDKESGNNEIQSPLSRRKQAKDKGEGLIDVVEAFQILASSISGLIGRGNDSDKEPFFEYFDPQEQQPSDPSAKQEHTKGNEPKMATIDERTGRPTAGQQPPMKTLDDVNAEWLRAFFFKPMKTSINCVSGGYGGIMSSEACDAMVVAVQRAQSKGASERGDASVLAAAVDVVPFSKETAPTTPSTCASSAPPTPDRVTAQAAQRAPKIVVAATGAMPMSEGVGTPVALPKLRATAAQTPQLTSPFSMGMVSARDKYSPVTASEHEAKVHQKYRSQVINGALHRP